jgi:hypothetical protein
MFLLSESLCAWILLLWILSDVTQGSILFGAGFCLVIFGWAVVGMIIEAYGFILLFRYVICLHHICKFLNLTLTTVANVTLVSLFVYTHHWELMKSVGSHSGLSLLFMMKGDARHSVSDTCKVIDMVMLVMLLMVLLQLTEWSPSKFCWGVFSTILGIRCPL